MNELDLDGLEGSDPLGMLAALGTLRIVASEDPSATLRWERRGPWRATLRVSSELDLEDVLWANVERWREGHPAIDFAVGADRKVQDLKHPPADFRLLMRQVAGDRDEESSGFVAAYATGVAVDGSGQTKPTSWHFTAGQQRFLDAVLDVRASLRRDDLKEALTGPWEGRTGVKDTRWQAGSQRTRALLPFDPSKEKDAAIVGAIWLAFQGMPFFPTAPVGRRIRTPGFTGRGKREVFTWPIWTVPLGPDEARVAIGLEGLEVMSPAARRARGFGAVLQARVIRNSQGYGNFSAAEPI